MSLHRDLPGRSGRTPEYPTAHSLEASPGPAVLPGSTDGLATVRAIFFDIDDTLTDYGAVCDYAFRQSLARIVERYPGVDAEAAVATFYRAKAAVEAVFSSRELPALAIRRKWFEALLQELAIDDALLIDDLVATFTEHREGYCVLKEGAAETLAALAARFPVGVISAGGTAIARFPLREYIHYPLFCREIGLHKPDPEVFWHAASLVGLAPEQVVYVGNDPHHDVAGAVDAGMWAIWFNDAGRQYPAELPPPHHEIRRLPELLGLLR